MRRRAQNEAEVKRRKTECESHGESISFWFLCRAISELRGQKRPCAQPCSVSKSISEIVGERRNLFVKILEMIKVAVHGGEVGR